MISIWKPYTWCEAAQVEEADWRGDDQSLTTQYHLTPTADFIKEIVNSTEIDQVLGT